MVDEATGAVPVAVEVVAVLDEVAYDRFNLYDVLKPFSVEPLPHFILLSKKCPHFVFRPFSGLKKSLWKKSFNGRLYFIL